MAYTITFTTKHGIDRFGSFDSWEEAFAASRPYQKRADRLWNAGVAAEIAVEGPPYVHDLDALDDLLTDMENDWLTDEEDA